MPPLLTPLRSAAYTVVATLILASATAVYIQTKRLQQAEARTTFYKLQADDLRDKVTAITATLDSQTRTIETWQAEAKKQEANAKTAASRADKLAQEAEELKQKILLNPPKPETKNYLDWILSKEN